MFCDGEYSHRYESWSAGLSVCFSGRERCKAGHSFGPAVRDHYIIHYVLRGKGRFEQDGQSSILKAGDGFLMVPYHTAAYFADEEDPWEYMWFAFRGEDAPVLLEHCGLSQQTPVFHYHLEEPLERRIPEQYRAGTVRDYRDFDALGELYRFLALLMRNYETHQIKQERKGQSLRQAMAFVEANYFNDFSVEEMASFVGLSRSQLYRIFKNTLGISTQAYILQYRLNKARYLVCNTELGVAEIALSCGFPDQSYFTRCFRARFGMAPLAYRSSDAARPVRA